MVTDRPETGALASLEHEILGLPVWDTHNHLETSEHLTAQSFWDVAHYFWFCRELQGIGYPGPDAAMALSESERAEAFARSFEGGRNTTWNRMVRRALKELWGVAITDAASILKANDAIAGTGSTPGWADEVCRRINAATITVGSASENGLHRIGERLYLMGVVRSPDAESILSSPDQAASATQAVTEMATQVGEMARQGRRVIRVELPMRTASPELGRSGNSTEDIATFLRHGLLRAMDEHHCHVQVYVGMETSPKVVAGRDYQLAVYALNDPGRVARMHELFQLYPNCTFEILNAANLSNMDIVQAARIYRNVVPGGLWWFNFRASTYRQTMQCRLEALPAVRCTLLASDARCIEWLYCKTLLVKTLLAEFLADQVRRGWLDEEAALYAAREWLHDAPARLYRRPGEHSKT